MLFSELLFYSDELDRLKSEEYKNRLTASAFTAYLGGAGGNKSFSVYLGALGLAEKSKPITKEQRKKITEKSRSVAERIMAMDKKRPRKRKR